MGAATAMAAAAAMAATLVAAFSAEQDTTATGAWWLLGETREEVRGSASRRDEGVWREADASASGAAPAGVNSAPYPQRGRADHHRGAGACVSRARRPIESRAGSNGLPWACRVRTLAATLAWALMPVDILEESLA